MSKVISYILAFLFLVFAGVQYNDADWYIWGPVYLLIAVLIFISINNKLPIKLLYLVLIGLIVWFFFLIPDLVNWLRDGMPSIVGSMKASNPEIELMREFFGILICILAMIWIWRKNKYN